MRFLSNTKKITKILRKSPINKNLLIFGFSLTPANTTSTFDITITNDFGTPATYSKGTIPVNVTVDICALAGKVTLPSGKAIAVANDGAVATFYVSYLEIG